MHRPWAAMLVLGAGLALAGCGGGEDGPEEVVRQLADAAGEKDWAAVCSLVDPEYLQEVTATGESCEQAMAAEDRDGTLLPDADKLEVGEAAVSDDGKIATVPTTYGEAEGEIILVRVDDTWRVRLT